MNDHIKKRMYYLCILNLNIYAIKIILVHIKINPFYDKKIKIKLQGVDITFVCVKIN